MDLLAIKIPILFVAGFRLAATPAEVCLLTRELGWSRNPAC